MTEFRDPDEPRAGWVVEIEPVDRHVSVKVRRRSGHLPLEIELAAVDAYRIGARMQQVAREALGDDRAGYRHGS